MIKTKQVVTVPLSGSALAWMPSKGNAKPEDFVFKLPSYISVNCQIKQWAKTAGLEKKTTFHTASHSKFFYLLNISELSILKNVTANDLETSYILFLSQLCNIQRTL